MSWNLFGWSFSVIRKQKQLILFPLLSAGAALAGVFLYFGGVRSMEKFLTHPLTLPQYLWLAPAYVVITFVIVFFNCGLAACANAHFSGQQPTLRFGLRHAAARIVPILAWSLLSATVGLLLNAIERRVSWAGKIAVWLFGFAWGMATYLVVPVLIAEDRGAFGSLRRSSQLLRETWGDQLVAELRFGWRFIVLFIPGLVLGAIGANGYPIVLPLAAAWFIIGIAVISAAKGVFEVALYRYAALNETPAGWSPEFLPGAFGGQDSLRTRMLDI